MKLTKCCRSSMQVNAAAIWTGKLQWTKFSELVFTSPPCLQMCIRKWQPVISVSCLRVKGSFFLYLSNQFQLRLYSSNGDSISLERYTLHPRANISGFSLPLTTSPNGSRRYQAGKPPTLLLLNFLKIIFYPVLVVLWRSLLTMQLPFGRRSLLIFAFVITLFWGTPQPTTLRGMGWQNPRTKP